MSRQRWLMASHPILPTYLKTLTYRTLWNLLPLKRNLDPNSCPICHQGQESAIHLFVNCAEVRKAWEIIKTVIQKITKLEESSFNPLIPINFCLNNEGTYLKPIAILFAVTNYIVWNLSIKCKNGNYQPKHEHIIAKVYNYCSIREKKEKKKIDQGFENVFCSLKNELLQQLKNLI